MIGDGGRPAFRIISEMEKEARNWFAPSRHPLTGLIGSLLFGMTVSGCAQFGPVAKEPACDGQPNWCLTVASEVMNDTGVYIDGREVATAPAEGVVKVPLPAGESHQINYCRKVRVDYELFGLLSKTKALCSKPAALTLTANENKIIYESSNMMY